MLLSSAPQARRGGASTGSSRRPGTYPRERRRFRRQPGEKLVDGRCGSFHLDQHALLVVEHEAGKVQMRGELIHVGANAHPLYDFPDARANAPGCGGDGRHREAVSRAGAGLSVRLAIPLMSACSGALRLSPQTSRKPIIP